MRSTTHMDEPGAATAPEDEQFDEPRQRLSWLRVGALVAIVAALAGGGFLGIKKVTTVVPPVQHSWSVPYVDVTLTPTYEFQNPGSNPARDIALAFVVADPDRPCTPSWGGAYTMEDAKQAIELERRISQLRAVGGDIMVSFGGLSNTELAVACTDSTALATAYADVIERYDVNVIDFDIEAGAETDHASIERRATAIAAVQAERSAAKQDLAVWLTLPVSTGGLTADALDVVRTTIDGGVKLTGVNVMTMNFGSSDHPTKDMLAATKSALTATAKQIGDLYAAKGVTLSEPERWSHLGATPMIGQNDVEGEVFTLDDAKGLADFATEKGLGRVSLWSLNRDTACSASFVDVMVLSNTCSSVEQEPLAFASVFTALPGRAAYLPQTDSVTLNSRERITDDPAASPYPIWRAEAQYPDGYKVVRHGLVYQAKWYNQGFDPTTQVSNEWDTPWSLVGPIGPDDVPFVPTTVAAGTYPDWDPKKLYSRRERVVLDGLPYEARWPNQGEVPPTLLPVSPDAAWEPLFTVPGEPTSS